MNTTTVAKSSTLPAAGLVLLAVLYPVNAGAIQAAGGRSVFWWLLGIILFAIPSTAVIIMLARQSGSPFVALRNHSSVTRMAAIGIWVAGALATISASTAALSYLERALGVEVGTLLEGVGVVILALLGVLAWRVRSWNVIIVVGATALVLVVAIAAIALVSAGGTAVEGSAVSESVDFSFSSGWTWLGLVVLGLVGVHEPYQRARLHPVGVRVLWGAMAAVAIGYVILTVAMSNLVPVSEATEFTSIADLGSSIGSSWVTVLGLLVALAFVGTVVGAGSVFRELQETLSLRSGSTVGLVAVAGLATFVLVPIMFEVSTVGSVYAVLQGAAAVLWALGYLAFGVIALRQRGGVLMTIAALLTVLLGAIGAIGVLITSFTPSLTGVGWTVSVLLLAFVALAVVWISSPAARARA